ncbi:transketolase [Egibacter rhizosphaerae]|uniref:Transketolase n=1 Tax=Egibacter rhizosphaerae TaxID=1670831 RepID=A0A411YI21_9ACTN|nr:transketolase C-terminal domain-containing protein [Egibacter rhizosphaerae]QBI20867.1 transketolase [Egibacter rhizosphaerae]
MHREPPFSIEQKPYGTALVELATTVEEVVCLSGDLTRQCEVDGFAEALPDRFLSMGMAEANMMGVAGGLARKGFAPFVHTFGVFATRRAYDQVAMAIAYPRLPVTIVGFMPGLSSPGGPSHQAIDDLALMRALPNMTVIDLADAATIKQTVPDVLDRDGPVYLRLKRGDIPVVFEEGKRLPAEGAELLRHGTDLAVVAAGTPLTTAIQATGLLEEAGVSTSLLHAPVVKPLAADLVRDTAASVDAVLVLEDHPALGGLASAVSEALSQVGCPTPLHKVGRTDTFAEPAQDRAFLYRTYGLTTQDVIDTAWDALERPGEPPITTPEPASSPDVYAPV